MAEQETLAALWAIAQAVACPSGPALVLLVQAGMTGRHESVFDHLGSTPPLPRSTRTVYNRKDKCHE